MPAGTKAKALTVDILKKSLKVQVKGSEPIVSGELEKAVKMEDCLCASPQSTPSLPQHRSSNSHTDRSLPQLVHRRRREGGE